MKKREKKTMNMTIATDRLGACRSLRPSNAPGRVARGITAVTRAVGIVAPITLVLLLALLTPSCGNIFGGGSGGDDGYLGETFTLPAGTVEGDELPEDWYVKVVLDGGDLTGSGDPAFGPIVDGDGSRYPGQAVPMPAASDLVEWNEYGLFESVDPSSVDDPALRVISISLLVGNDEARTNANRGWFDRGTESVSVRWLYADRACRIVHSDDGRELNLTLKRGWNRVLGSEVGDTYRYTVGNEPFSAVWSFEGVPTAPVFEF